MGLMQQVGRALFKSNLPSIEKALEKEMVLRVRACTQVVRTETLRVLSGPRHGRHYYLVTTKTATARRARGGKRPPVGLGSRGGKLHIASAAGEAPATMYGRLRQSVKTRVESDSESATGYVGTDLEKGLRLQMGTRRMAPRPWLSRAFRNSVARCKAILSRRTVL